jgi:hypothetical protein
MRVKRSGHKVHKGHREGRKDLEHSSFVLSVIFVATTLCLGPCDDGGEWWFVGGTCDRRTVIDGPLLSKQQRTTRQTPDLLASLFRLTC